MPFFRRPAAEPTPSGIPAFAAKALAKAHLSGMNWRRSEVAGDRGLVWAVEVPGGRAITLWEQLRSSAEPGWCPAVLGSSEDEERVAENAESCEEAPSAILEASRSLDPVEYLRMQRAANEPTEEELEDWDLVGTWPTAKVAPATFTLPFDIRIGRPRPTIVAIVAADHDYEVPAVLGWGAWNDCPPPYAHVSVLRRWADIYGAEIVGLSADVLEMRVARPPTTRDAAMALADEHYSYCSDIVTQGTESISNLAASLLDARCWYFWWD